jgi:nucleoside-diphosphate-sugar epimerase
MRAEAQPSRYIARVRLDDGTEIPGPIRPEELLVHAYRDRHPLELAAQYVASRVVGLTGREALGRDGLRRLSRLGRLLGVAAPPAFGFRFREPARVSDREARRRVSALQREAARRLGRRPSVRLLLTGATGFVGKEILVQAAAERRIVEVVAVTRPETVYDPKTKAVVRTLRPEERGAQLLARLGIAGAAARKFRFVRGDVERPHLGLAPAERRRLAKRLTHVIHCAASVAFDDPYEASFRANVVGCRNALRFSLGLQETPGSAFVQHVAIETSYVHGRKRRGPAQESGLVFPRHHYNNFYELTKAMASLETDRFLVERGLRVAQLLPSIVIGDARTGNNRGDTKVVNAPINAFGRAHEAALRATGRLLGVSKARAIEAVACVFPGDRTAEMNLVPVDRVVAGILAALFVPGAIGARVHLATDNRIRASDMLRVIREELGVRVRLADPTLYRNLTMPLMRAVLEQAGEPKLARALERLSTIFGSYGEWGQPVHEVGNDVRLLRLPLRRPDTRHAFRMLCRHNRYVQEYGRVRDADEIARREGLWAAVLAELEHESGRPAGALGAAEFARRLGEKIEFGAFERRALRRGKGRTR